MDGGQTRMQTPGPSFCRRPHSHDVRGGRFDSRPPIYSSCLALEQEVLNREVTFLMNENWLLGGRSTPDRVRLCNHFLNVVLFRDPIERILSHIRYFQAIGSKMPAEVLPFTKLAPIITNNYFIRVILGEHIFRLDDGSVSEAHLEKAVEVLESFDVVFVLETMEFMAPILMQRAFGWDMNRLPSLNHHHASPKETGQGKKNGDKDRHDNGQTFETITLQERRLLEDRNSLDIRLHARAQELAELDFEYFRQIQQLAEKKQLVFPQEHQWKAFPSMDDPHVKCKQSCGYVCQIDFEK